MLLPLFAAVSLSAAPLPDEAALKKMTAKLVPVELTADLSKLPATSAPRWRRSSRQRS